MQSLPDKFIMSSENIQDLRPSVNFKDSNINFIIWPDNCHTNVTRFPVGVVFLLVAKLIIILMAIACRVYDLIGLEMEWGPDPILGQVLSCLPSWPGQVSTIWIIGKFHIKMYAFWVLWKIGKSGTIGIESSLAEIGWSVSWMPPYDDYALSLLWQFRQAQF